MPSRKEALITHHVCPWWLAYTFDNPVRKLFHRPSKILGSYIEKGMRVVDVGCGMGYFSVAMAEMVGDKGKVVAIDLQRKMLEITTKRATRAGLGKRIFPRRCQAGQLALAEKADFILAFWMVHEVKNKISFFSELHSNLAAGGKILIAEPKMHVSTKAFQETLGIAQSTGLRICGQPAVRFSHTALFESIPK